MKMDKRNAACAKLVEPELEAEAAVEAGPEESTLAASDTQVSEMWGDQALASGAPSASEDPYQMRDAMVIAELRPCESDSDDEITQDSCRTRLVYLVIMCWGYRCYMACSESVFSLHVLSHLVDFTSFINQLPEG